MYKNITWHDGCKNPTMQPPIWPPDQILVFSYNKSGVFIFYVHNDEKPKLKEYDCVELIVDRKRYAKEGVYKGMQGWICHEKSVEGFSLVDFPLYGKAGSIATISIHDEDLRIITQGGDWINDRIKKEHGQ